MTVKDQKSRIEGIYPYYKLQKIGSIINVGVEREDLCSNIFDL